MIVLEPGPRMGFFTLELARRVGSTGRVIAVEVQPRKLEALVRRAEKAGLADRIEARQPEGDGLGIKDDAGKIDFALAFAMIHEVREPEALLGDIHQALKAGGKLLIAEPAGHVRADAFAATLRLAKESGFALESRPAVWGSHTAVLLGGCRSICSFNASAGFILAAQGKTTPRASPGRGNHSTIGGNP
jgi:tRNA A58 N-methylase Trm61